ncbi:MAG: hypothetical protein LBM02_09775 [Lachnospiraceae bacterium]|jgi:hypothetical protein|nr:hypothetical protein [Lachnospiraceae bacterium]
MKEVLIKSKERVRKYAEVFTPLWIVEKMLNQEGIKEKTEDLHATFFEPSSGEGIFLVEILKRKLATISDNTAQLKDWQRDALFALASIYAVELLDDNLEISHKNLLQVLQTNFEKRFGKNSPRIPIFTNRQRR